MIKRIWNKGRKQKIILLLVGIGLLLALFILRDDYQPGLLFVRKYVFIILLIAILLFLAVYKFRSSSSIGVRMLILGIVGIFFVGNYYIGWKLGMYDYMQKYNIFNNLDLEEIDELPLTRNERIQPYNNIRTMAYESISETQEVSAPQLVRIDSTNKWTMAVQPAKEYRWQRINDNTEEIFSVPSTTPFPRFAGESRIPATFSIGESLAFSRNTYNAVVQRFNIFQLFTLEPDQVYYMKNDKDQWVQVVSLIRWKGFFFPYPSFGGVMIIDSGKHDFQDYIERILVGKGTYVSPDKMKDYPFLQRQNTLSEKVSRLQAESLMFLGGFTDPLPWNMETAVKIPDLEDDQNQQPFVTDFDFTGMDLEAYNGLYHWFGLEPIGEERTSLAFSVFIPADGTDKLWYYNHSKRKEGIAGVSAMPLKVIESKKEYDWTINTPVEFRPFIKDIAGRKRMFMLSTIATKRDKNKKFDGSATPDLALVDVEYRDVIWVDAKHPSTWDKMIYDQFHEVWRASENIGHFYKDEIPQEADTLFEKDSISADILPIQTQKDSTPIPSQEIDSIISDTITNR